MDSSMVRRVFTNLLGFKHQHLELHQESGTLDLDKNGGY